MDRDERDVKNTPDDAEPETEEPVDGPGRSDDDSDADQSGKARLASGQNRGKLPPEATAWQRFDSFRARLPSELLVHV